MPSVAPLTINTFSVMLFSFPLIHCVYCQLRSETSGRVATVEYNGPVSRKGTMANQTPAAGTDIVLVADDNASLRSKIGDYLAIEDIRSAEAGDGKMALAEAMRVHPSVVLLDIKMPALDGLSAAKLIVELPWRPKVILMSGFDDS
ncbi:MAG TPA: response regulator, partial [Alphaproteobacteria bacterium]|nr:response regulator [Alphaproteobacteria bacterium]